MLIAVCDDNEVFLSVIREKIDNILNTHKMKHEVVLFRSGNELLERITTTSFDIVFLDIDMPDINGKQLAQKLRTAARNKFKLVFVSDYNNEVFSTFQYNIESFIPKCRLDEFLSEELLRIIEILKNEKGEEFTFRYNDNNRCGIVAVFVSDIMFIETLGGKIYLHTANKKYELLNYKFEKIKSQFIKYDFVDIHRTCFVNVAYISAVGKDQVILRNGMQLPLSRRKKKKTDDFLFNYVKESVVK